MVVEILRNWIANIMVVVAISILAEIITPEGVFKKYIKLIVGIVIMIMVIKPILPISKGQNILDDYVVEAIHQMSQTTVTQQNELLKQTQIQQIVQAYHKQLSEQIKQKVESESGLQVIDWNVEIIDDIYNSKFGTVKKIHLTLAGKKPEKNEVREVSQIVIGNGGNNNVTLSEEENKIAEQVKDSLNRTYDVSRENIHIQIQKN